MCHMWKGGGEERKRDRMNGTFFLSFNGLQLGSIFVFNSRANNNSQKVKWCWWCIITISSSPPHPINEERGWRPALLREREREREQLARRNLLPLSLSSPPSCILIWNTLPAVWFWPGSLSYTPQRIWLHQRTILNDYVVNLLNNI